MRRGALPAVALVLALVASGCGDDGDDGGDEASFCRLAAVSAPVPEASAEVMARLVDLAPPEIVADVEVLRDLADRLDEPGTSDSEALAIEFEVRFSDEYIAARVAVEDYVEEACAEEIRRATSTTTTTGSSPSGSATTEADVPESTTSTTMATTTTDVGVDE